MKICIEKKKNQITNETNILDGISVEVFVYFFFYANVRLEALIDASHTLFV